MVITIHLSSQEVMDLLQDAISKKLTGSREIISIAVSPEYDPDDDLGDMLDVCVGYSEPEVKS